MKKLKVWVVWFGGFGSKYYTHYHAEQMARALRLNGTPYTITEASE